ncbi:MAG: SHOCT domain-containing protein [Actinobacteria bacterium]|nr:SHOCT domain-containing protein [Actinomycetota bacterium]
MKPTVAQRVLLSVGLGLNLLFGILIYMNEYGSPLWTSEIFQLVRIVVTLMALIMGFSGKKRLTFPLIYFGSFLVGIILNFVIGFNFLASIYRGLFNVRSWMYLDLRELMPYIIITLIVNSPFLVAFILGLAQKPKNESHLVATQFSNPGAMPHSEVRSLRSDLESLAGLLREGLITQEDYDRKKEELLRRL